jgi:hypothetical protein
LSSSGSTMASAKEILGYWLVSYVHDSRLLVVESTLDPNEHDMESSIAVYAARQIKCIEADVMRYNYVIRSIDASSAEKNVHCRHVPEDSLVILELSIMLECGEGCDDQIGTSGSMSSPTPWLAVRYMSLQHLMGQDRSVASRVGDGGGDHGSFVALLASRGRLCA